jgi:hypothetical protein
MFFANKSLEANVSKLASEMNVPSNAVSGTALHGLATKLKAGKENDIDDGALLEKLRQFSIPLSILSVRKRLSFGRRNNQPLEEL